jgi:hypothetical protein
MPRKRNATVNLALKNAIATSAFGTQRRFVEAARRKGLGIDEPRLSRIVRRVAAPTTDEREAFESLLGVSAEQLFDEAVPA